MSDHCKWAGRGEPRVVSNRHREDCRDDECRGCQPCRERHCQVCNKEHVTVEGVGTDETCASCIGETRGDISHIVEMAGRMLVEALVKGVNSEAAVLAGPSADPEAWGYRRQSAIQGRIDPSWLDDCKDERHPLWVLGTWDMLIREHLTQPTEDLVTITGSAGYLSGHLTRLAHDEAFAFEEMARDLRGCRGYMEDVLLEGERDIKGAPCVQCKTVMVRIVLDDGTVTDRWWCSRCRRDVTDNQYRLAVRAAHTAHADRLCLTDMAERTGVAGSTLRRWASVKRRVVEGHWSGDVWVDGYVVEEPPLLRWRGKDSSNRKLYRVEDVEALRDTRLAS